MLYSETFLLMLQVEGNSVHLVQLLVYLQIKQKKTKKNTSLSGSYNEQAMGYCTDYEMLQLKNTVSY